MLHFIRFNCALVTLMLVIAFTTTAQTKNQFKGRVVDSANHVPIEMATVAVMEVKDTVSTLISYTLTDKEGNFILHGIPAGVNLKLLVSFISYNSYRKLLTLNNKTENMDFGTIGLSNKLLKEITIRDRPPIVIRADTIEFAAEAFKVRPNAVVEDLLKKLPGVEVSGDGTVTVAGKPVSKIYVDGHEYFANDQRIATKNLDVALIDKVQVYDDRENDPNHVTPAADVNKIINLKFKKEYKKSIFGKVFLGVGTEDRYETGGLINMFRDTLQVSLLGVSNNLNNTGFSFTDLYTSGGLNRGGTEAAARAGLGAFGGAGSGIQKIISGGVNINNDYGKKLKVNLSYYYNHLINDYNSLSNTQRLLNDTTLTSRTATSRVRYDTRHVITSSVRWAPDNATSYLYTPSINIDNNSSATSTLATTFSNFIPLITQSNTADRNNGSSVGFSQNFTYNHQFKKAGQALTISHSLNISPNNSGDFNVNQVSSFTSLLPSYLLNRFTNSVSKSTDASVNETYRISVNKKLNFSVAANSAYRHAVNNVFAFDLDTLSGHYDAPVVNLSSALTRNSFTQTLSPGFTYAFSDGRTHPFMQLNASVNLEMQNVNNHFDRGAANLNQQFFNAFPVLNFNYGKFAAGYSESMQLPNIGDLIPYTVVYSPLYSVTGNPDLKPTYRHNFSIRYTNYNFKTRNTFSANINYTTSENSVFRQRTLDQAGIETSRPINMSGARNVNGSILLSKPIKKTTDLNITSSTNLGVTYFHNFFELNGQNGFQNSIGGILTESINFNWKDKIELSPSYVLSAQSVKYTGINYPNQSQIAHNAGSHFMFYWNSRTSIEGSYNYTYNPLVPPGFQKSANLLSMNIARTLFANGKGQIKLTCYDILNQSIGTTRSINENVITDNQSEILKRYFLLTFQYSFIKSLTRK